MTANSIKLRLAAAAMLLIGVSESLGQVCIDRPLILRPMIEKSVIQRPIFIRPIIMKPVIEQPNFVRAAIEREVIEQPKFDQPIFDWCGDAFYPLDAATEGEAPTINRSLRGMFNTGQYTPGPDLKRAYLKAVTTPPVNSNAIAGERVEAEGSCCGDAPTRAAANGKLLSKKVRPLSAIEAFNKRASTPWPAPAIAKSTPVAPTATARAVMATTMVVPRGSR